MMGLYRKNETLFAVLLIVVYVVVGGTLRNIGDDSPAMVVGLAAIAFGLLAFVARNGLGQKYGLTRWTNNARQMLYLAPLWIVTSANLWGGVEPHYAGVGLLCAIASMALVGLVEELIFRGFLFEAMLENGSATTAIVVSAVTFGIGHIVNLFTGHALLETSAQIVFAIAVGFMFTLVRYKGGSLLPCIVAHSLIDVFSVVSRRSGVLDWISIAVCLAVAAIYSIYLWRIEV